MSSFNGMVILLPESEVRKGQILQSGMDRHRNLDTLKI